MASLSKVIAAITTAMADNVDELALFGSLAVFVLGLWPLLERFTVPGQASLVVAGAVLVWVFLPQRERFVRPRPIIQRRGRQKDTN